MLVTDGEGLIAARSLKNLVTHTTKGFNQRVADQCFIFDQEDSLPTQDGLSLDLVFRFCRGVGRKRERWQQNSEGCARTQFANKQWKGRAPSPSLAPSW